MRRPLFACLLVLALAPRLSEGFFLPPTNFNSRNIYIERIASTSHNALVPRRLSEGPSLHSRNIELLMSAFDEYAIEGPPTETTDVMIQDLRQGSGTPAKEGDVLSVSYTGRFIATGKEFDNGIITFTLGDGRVIPGWECGLLGVQKGGIRQLKIPPSYAYGASGVGTVIPPNAHLEFDIRVKDIATNNIQKTIARLSGLMDIYSRKETLS
jgi:hypothetical protein